MAPQYVAEELLRAEGFTEVTYVATGPGAATASAVANGEIDFSLNFVTNSIVALDSGARITLLGGVHPGCFELFVKRGIDSVVDLKGRNVGVQGLGSGPHLFLASIAAYVGLDPARDINWVVNPKVKPKELFARGDVDAFLGFPPDPQELRRSKVGHVIVNSTLDRPWSQYFCCMLSGNSDFVAAHPVATKRVLRAILKAADLCTAAPAMVAERLVAGGFASNYDDAFAAISELPYRKWRDYDSTDTVRFYALRLKEIGLISSTPDRIIAEGTDWRFLNELKRELKNLATERRLAMSSIHNRRRVLAGLSAMATGLIAPAAGAEPPLDTTSVRLPKWDGGAYCWAGNYMAGELLRADGFTDVRYVQGDPKLDQSAWIANGDTDFSINYVPIHVASIDTGVPVKVLAGLHSGCQELIANNSIQSIPQLKGKRVGIHTLDSLSHVMVALMAAYVGLDPVNEIEWIADMDAGVVKMFAEGKVDAFLATPPSVQELRSRKIGHTIVNTTTDKPWSQHFCCMISATADYLNNYPVATKRVLRAIFKSADLCVTDPQMVAQQLVERGFVPSYDYALQTLNDLRYDRWRDYDPEAAVRFFALRMQETGMIKSRPQQIIADGTDWRFLEELKRELKT